MIPGQEQTYGMVPPEQMDPGGMPPEGEMLEEDEGAPRDPNDPDVQAFETISAGLIEFIYGKGEEGIAIQLSEAAGEELGETMGRITVNLVVEGVEQATQQMEVDMDIVLGVSTEVIDALIDMSEAMSLQMPEREELSKHALISAVNQYVSTHAASDEEREAAAQMLQQMDADGDTALAAETLGVDPAQMQAAPGPEQPPQPGQPPASLMGA